MLYFNVSILLSEVYDVVSSANCIILELFIDRFMSFMYKRKSNGPKLLPRGIPWVIVSGSDSLLFIKVFCVLLLS